MKKLITYYSLTGNNKKAALELKKILKADIDEIKDETNYKGIFGFLKAGFNAITRKTTKIITTKKPSDYDEVILCTPVWAGNITPAARTYLLNNKIKNLFLFSVSGQGPKNTLVVPEIEKIIGKKLTKAIMLTEKYDIKKVLKN